MRRTTSLQKTLMLGKIESRRRRGWQRMRWLDGITDSMDMNLSKLQDMVRDREPRHATVHGVTKSRTRLGNCMTEQQDPVECTLQARKDLGDRGIQNFSLSSIDAHIVGATSGHFPEVKLLSKRPFSSGQSPTQTHDTEPAWRDGFPKDTQLGPVRDACCLPGPPQPQSSTQIQLQVWGLVYIWVASSSSPACLHPARCSGRRRCWEMRARMRSKGGRAGGPSSRVPVSEAPSSSRTKAALQSRPPSLHPLTTLGKFQFTYTASYGLCASGLWPFVTCRRKPCRFPMGDTQWPGGSGPWQKSTSQVIHGQGPSHCF